MKTRNINNAFSAESIVIIVESNWIQLKTTKLVCLVCFVFLIERNQRDKPNKPDRPDEQVNQINRKGLGPSQRSQALAYRKGLAVYV